MSKYRFAYLQQKAKFSNLFSATVGINQKDIVDKMVRKVRMKLIFFLHLLPEFSS